MPWPRHSTNRNVLEETFPIILTEPILLEYLDVLARPAVRGLTGLNRRQSEELVTDLISLSHKVQLRFSWRPNLRDDMVGLIAAAPTRFGLEQALNLFADSWKAMKPLLDFVLSDE